VGLKLTIDEARSLGLDVPRSRDRGDGMNKLERRFMNNVLEPAYVRGDLARYYREPMRLVLPGNVTYRPDFLAIVRDDRPTFCETKGFMRDDARVKLCVAAGTFPDWRWLLVEHERIAGWLVWEVTGRGIGADSIHVRWIHGGRA
jgi:hypothetical protein